MMDKIITAAMFCFLLLLTAVLVAVPLMLWQVIRYTDEPPDLKVTWVKVHAPADGAIPQYLPCSWHPSWGGPDDVQCDFGAMVLGEEKGTAPAGKK